MSPSTNHRGVIPDTPDRFDHDEGPLEIVMSDLVDDLHQPEIADDVGIPTTPTRPVGPAGGDQQARHEAALESVMTAVTVSIIIPTLNEAKNLPAVFERLPNGLHEVIVVDGHSTDDTLGVAALLRPDVIPIRQTGRGKGNALACGFWAATGDIVVMLDGDGSTDPAEIPRFVSALLTGADFAKGTRFVTGGGSSDITRIRWLGNRVLSGIVNTLWGVNYSDLCYGYNAFWRRCLPQISPDCSGFEVETLMNIRAARSGLKVHEVPSAEGNRQHGTSNLHARRDGVRVLRTIAAERIRST